MNWLVLDYLFRENKNHEIIRYEKIAKIKTKKKFTFQNRKNFYTRKLLCLRYIPVCYKTQKTCDKAVNDYPSAMQIVPKLLKEMCDKAAVDTCPLVFHSVSDQYKT